jgi:hypothetical protein
VRRRCEWKNHLELLNWLEVVCFVLKGQMFRAEAVFFGLAAAAVKSALLALVSVHPPAARVAAVVAVSAGAAPAPSKKFAVP